MRSIAKKISIITAVSLFTAVGANAQDGAALFKAKCSACHSVGSNRLVGPGLAGINEKRSQEWLINWIKDSQALIASGDADAIAIFEEYNKSPMIPFSDMSDEEIIAMLDYIKSESSPSSEASSEGEEVVAEPVEEVNYTAEDIEAGRLLFAGGKSFENGGPSCVVCHNVTNDAVIPGGLLAKDLTNVYGRLGGAGVGGIVSAPPFPAMVNAYKASPITEEEVMQLTAFFKSVNKDEEVEASNKGFQLLAGGGAAGLLIILVLISIIWSVRKKESTKKDIFARQLKGNDSVES